MLHFLIKDVPVIYASKDLGYTPVTDNRHLRTDMLIVRGSRDKKINLSSSCSSNIMSVPFG